MFTIRLDTKQLTRELVDFRRDQLPFWLSLTLNRVAGAVQEAQKQVIMQRGGYRSSGSLRWALNQVRFDRQSRATKDKLRAEVYVWPGTGVYSLLPVRERGGTHLPSRGATLGVGIYGPRVAVPLQDGTPRKLYPVNLGLQPRRAIEGGHTLGRKAMSEDQMARWGRTRNWRGRERTWLMKTSKGPMVFQRTGRGNTTAARRPLFALKPWVPVPAIGGGPWFSGTAQRVTSRQAGAIAYGAWQQAMRTARAR
jgi:hypothetical protein